MTALAVAFLFAGGAGLVWGLWQLRLAAAVREVGRTEPPDHLAGLGAGTLAYESARMAAAMAELSAAVGEALWPAFRRLHRAALRAIDPERAARRDWSDSDPGPHLRGDQ